jgi:hypothetical protein
MQDVRTFLRDRSLPSNCFIGGALAVDKYWFLLDWVMMIRGRQGP